MFHRAIRNFIRVVSATAAATIFLLPAGARAQTLFQPLSALNTQSVTLPAGNTPLGVAVADFNHDGYPDMVVANYADTSVGTTGSISVYLSNGSGKFGSPAKYPTCGGPTAVLAEDLDLTGLPDIVITCNTPTSNVIQVFLNLGNGTFDPTMGNGTTNIVLGTGVGPVSIVSGDFNSDGHPDLAVANHDGTITLFLSNAAVNFTYYTVKPISGGFGTLTGITAGRFTNSGNLDLAVTDATSNGVHLLIGDGTGNFSVAQTLPAAGVDPTGIASGDFNKDGYPDLAVVYAGNGMVGLFLGQGNGNFSSSTPISVGPSSGTGATAIIAADIESNGNLDLITGNVLQNNVAVLVNNGDGTFQPVQNYAVPNGPGYLAMADFNRDGKPDLAVTQSKGSAVSLLINNTLPTPQPGGRSFLPPTLLPNGNGNMADAVAVADFNHDGFLDAATAYLEDNVVKVQLATGKGMNFDTSVASYAVGKQPYALVAHDLNNDGYPDLVTANTTDGTVSVLMNNANGTGTFSTATTLTVGRLPYGVAVGDVNGDGIPDIVAANYGDNSLTIIYGPFNAGFQTVQALTTCTNPYGVQIGDFRHTGQNDIAVTCFGSNEVEIFLNKGMMPFQPPMLPTSFAAGVLYPTDTKPTSLVLGDFNRDGKLDIATGNSTANDVSFFAGKGDGTFGSAVNSFALNFPDSIAAGDINGDGILDLVAVAPNFNKATVLVGKGDGTFQPRFDFTTGTQPWAVALGDFNLDGKLDIVTANTFNRVNLTIPAYQQMYMKEFPPVPGGNPSVSVLLNSSGTNIAVTATPNGTVANNQPITVTATVTPTLGTTTPTGSVIFEDTDGTPSPAIPLTGGTATLTINNPGTGTHRITALYSGDILYQPNTAVAPANQTVTVGGTPVVLTVPQNITPNTAVSYSVTAGTANPAAPNPVGTITLFATLPNGQLIKVDGPVAIGTPGTGGVSTVNRTLGSGVPPGNYYAYAVFTPAAGSTYAAGSSPQVLVISQ